MRAVLVSLLLVVLPFSSLAGTERATFTKHYDDSIFKVTEKGLFSLEIVMKDSSSSNEGPPVPQKKKL